MKTKVMAFGTFDYLHAGHEYFLKEASQLGDQLIVVVARDRTAESIRGQKPDHHERQRIANVKTLPFVTKVVLGDHEDKYKVIRKYKPGVIALGYDQFVFTQRLNRVLIDLKLNTQVKRLEPYRPEIYKSSLIKRSLQNGTPSQWPSLKPSNAI